MTRAGELLGVYPQSLVASPLEQFPGKGEGLEGEETAPPHVSSPPLHEAEEAEYTGSAVKRYFGIASILASVSAVLIAMSVWIILQ